MPSMGEKQHARLRTLAIQKLAMDYGEKLRDVGVESVRFQVDASIGNYRARFEQDAKRQLFPDIYAVLADGVESRGGYDIIYKNPRAVVIECEQDKSSTLITGKPSLRKFGYQFLKEKHKDKLTFILVTWDDIEVKNDMWDQVWKFPREEKPK